MIEDALNLDDISRAPVLLVATDYDGTLAPLASEPSLAEAHRESIVALKALAALPQTHVAVISGRALADLSGRLRDVDAAHFVGSHGSEFDHGCAASIPQQSLLLRDELIERARRIAAKYPGTMVEPKPAALAFHYRNADETTAAAAVNELLKSVEGIPGCHVRHGKKVVELSVVETNKGRALQLLRQRLGATAVIFMGDDVTDEDAFATLAGPDIGIKVGDGPTVARHRLQTALDVARVLAALAEKRSAWLAGSEAVPIERHSLVSDQRTCALVSPHGRVCWLCVPRIDSPALFAELLGGPSAGYFEVCPVAAGATPTQQYIDSTFVLKTDWGDLRVTDYMDCSAGRPFQRAGRTDLIRVIEGHGRVRITFAPRITFGTVETRLTANDAGLAVEGTVDPCVLVAPGLHWTIQREGHHDTAVSELDIGGGPFVLEMRFGTSSRTPASMPEARRRESTERFWNVWASTLSLPAKYREPVRRSALVLRALCYGPTGAIAAAATTSLPEHAGGVRNWDYRFCWPRDAAMAATALARLGAPGPAMKYLDWVLGIFENIEAGAMIRPVYTVTGGNLGPEGIVAELPGYRGSRPVRVGNMAAQQIQLDVLGPIAELLALLADQGASLTPEHWRLTESMVHAVSARWQEEDHGIWEIRAARKHHVHSKVMCWQTVDCALRVTEYMGRRREDWIALRQQIAQEVLERGWNQDEQAFCSSYESSQIDAASLFVGLSGLLPQTDPRFASTVRAVERALREGPTVYRYRYEDGLPGIEGGFNICTSWLIEAYALLGRRADAEELFEQYIALAGPTGLIPEEYDPRARSALGNVPQAYSHIGLINAALRLEAIQPPPAQNTIAAEAI
jgi:trehalose-phosphatase